MSKRKKWGAYCILTVLAVALFLLGTFLAEKLTAFGGRHYDYFLFFIIILICLPLLWGLLLSVRSRCYRRVIGKASDLIPEILMILLGFSPPTGSYFMECFCRFCTTTFSNIWRSFPPCLSGSP